VTPLSWTAVGCVLSTATVKFGTASLLNAGSQRVSAPDNAVFNNLGLTPFVFDCWINTSVFAASSALAGIGYRGGVYFDLFSNDTAENARDMANAGATAGYGQLSDMYGQGRGALTDNYGKASDLYKGLINSTGSGAKAYGDASGANGVAGLQSAMDTFKNSGQYGNYGFALDQGLNALNRTHAAAGNLSSGNADTDSMKYATGLANNTYSSYLSGLSPYLGANSQRCCWRGRR
jgi:hypothetical protein